MDAVLAEALREVWEALRRIVGVRRDSRALGSSSVVNLPMAGRYTT